MAVAALLLGACGSDDDDGRATLNWFIFNEPSGVLEEVAATCSQESNGAYRINFEYLPAQADQQREQLVRRLGAEDDTLDILGLDVIWTGEFANAGWLEEWTGENAAAATDGVFQSMVDTASFEGKLWAAPAWTNTQLLWYRTDRVQEPPETWEETFQAAERIGEQGQIQVQANRYEGLVVWINSMIASAGTSVVEPEDPQAVALEPGATAEALAIMGRLANSPFADPSFSTSTEDSARLGFETGGSSFMLNYPFVHPSAEANAPEVFENMGAARYPAVSADQPSRPPLGGIILGVSAFSDNKEQSFDAIRCITGPEHQLQIAEAAGLPPVIERLYDEPELRGIYPGFADLMRESIEAAAPRPVTPAYQDLSLAIQRSMHPIGAIDPDNPESRVEELREKVETAIRVEGLL